MGCTPKLIGFLYLFIKRFQQCHCLCHLNLLQVLMLCIQLLRFNYDQRLGRRVKQAAPVRLPDLLDMEPFIAEDPSEHEDVPQSDRKKKRYLYRISGVLLHLGRYSTSGHYIAVVRCSEGSKEIWKVCNDETVSLR